MRLYKDNLAHRKRVSKIAHEQALEEAVVEEVLDLMYSYIRKKYSEITADRDRLMDKEEFDRTFPSFRIPKLGYFRPSYRRYLNINKKKNGKNNKKGGKRNAFEP